MIDVRIVCTHDAVKLAETLARLLAAEDFQVRLNYGRNSLHELESAAAETGAVLMVWSLDAPSAHYMLQWAAQIGADRLVEIARAPNWPRVERRRAPVIDFSNWRGERGGRAWNALIERLRVVQRAFEPKGPPPRRAAMALGLVAAAAVGGALVERVQDNFQPESAPTAAPAETMAAITVSTDGVGGPLQAVEPASIEDVQEHFGPFAPRVAHMLPPDLTLTDIDPAPEIIIARERSLLSRIGGVAASLRDAALGEHQDAAPQPQQQASNE